MEKMTQEKIVVIGLDGAEWKLIKYWTDREKLPAFKKFIQKGVWGELESSMPPVTFPAWKCYSTGKNPGKLGVYWWTDADFERGRFNINDSNSFKSYDMWDYMGKENLRVGIINMPSTYPPNPVNGFMIAGFPASDTSNYTFPHELKSELVKKFGYRINPKYHIQVYRKKALDEIKVLFEKRFEVAKKYINKIDFMHLTIFYLDDVQHFFWKNKNLILEFYEIIDARISEIIDLIGEKGHVFIMSDHGFTELLDTFYINEWLSKKGYLVKKKKFAGITQKLGITQDRIINLGKSTRLLPLFLSRIPRKTLMKIKRIIPVVEGKAQDEGVESIIDWERSNAVALKQGPLYLNKKKLSKSEYRRIIEELKHELLEVEHPITKEKIINKIFYKEEIYSGQFVNIAPDLIIQPRNGYEIGIALSLDQNFDGKVNREFESLNSNQPQVFNKWIATHRRHGIFMAHGRNFRTGKRINNTKIIDLAPTILHMLNVEIPTDFDGKVIKDIFIKDSEPDKREIKSQLPLRSMIEFPD